MVHFRNVVLSAATLAVATAQRVSRIVPAEISSGFDEDIQVQASYDDNAVNGFQDGTAFEKDAVSQEPTFALGDSTGISPTTLYTILLIDTTCSTRTLHYARANFKNNFDITNIATDSEALQAYKAPGSFGETGDNRQYSFLMYTNPGRKEITELQLPGEGEPFDVKKFQDDNGLPDPSAGLGMVVKLGGQADCGNGEAPNSLPASLASPRPGRSSTVAAGTSAAGTSAVASSTVTAGTTAVASSSVAAGSTAAASSVAAGISTATPTLVTSSIAGIVPSGNATVPTTSAVGGSPGDDDGSSENPTGAPGFAGPSTITSTVDLATNQPSGSPTSSSGPAEQTTNAGSKTLVGGAWMLFSLLAVAIW